jgi:DNA-binding transcriptional ArsR family regulator
VGEIAHGLPVSRPAVSQHLKALKEAGLVTDRRAGNRSIYRLNPEGVGAMRAYLDRFWTDALAGLQDGRRATTRGGSHDRAAGHQRA